MSTTVAGSRGVKRKRGAVSKEEDVGVKVKGKLHHEVKEVRKVAKKAKAFETQKIVKKLKSLRAKDPKANEKSIGECENEMEILKKLDHEAAANRALTTKLNKDRMLSQNEHMQTALQTELSSHSLTLSAPGSAARKVEDRLLSSKILAVEIQSVVMSLKQILDPSTQKAPQEGDDEDEEGAILPSNSKRHRVAASDDQSDEGNSDSDKGAEAQEEAGWVSGSVLDDDDEDAADGWESGSVDSRNLHATDSEDAGPDLDSEGGGSEDEDTDVDVSASSDASRPKQIAEKGVKSGTVQKDPKGKSKALAESTFLPSLSVGFTRGDSDASDLSDAETNVADGVRKNRRGQRARRAIWEKKYGGNANHVKKEREVAAQNPRRNFKKLDSNKKDHSRTSIPRNRANPGARTSFNAPASDKGWARSPVGDMGTDAQARQKDDKPLHPSWEAKRRLKEKLNPSIVPGQGKKITFS